MKACYERKHGLGNGIIAGGEIGRGLGWGVVGSVGILGGGGRWEGDQEKRWNREVKETGGE
jgi:hypothetical protein